ncbi:MAG: LuxR C-terminal-related transcriptional regulator [Nakamurella sp.]
MATRAVAKSRAAVTGAALARSMPNNRRICAGYNGLRMVSIFDFESTEPEARSLLEHEPSTDYYYAFAPMQIKIVDRRQVLMQGPVDDPEQTLISLTSGRALSAASTYWTAVRATAAPCRRRSAVLSARQVEIFDLMLTGLTDEVIARTLEVSVRTVRGDVSTAEMAMGVRSRFAAGFAFAAGHHR